MSTATAKIPDQELTKYNRESGRKTLYFVGGLILLVVVLTVTALLLVGIH